jgi:hypothetical protein
MFFCTALNNPTISSYFYTLINYKMKAIGFTKVSLPYGWMGNMSPYPINYGGKVWKTTEALFQSLRFEDEEIKEAIRGEASPMGCKFKVKAIVKKLKESNELHKRTVEPLSDQDVKNMELCIRLKIEQHPELLKELLKTGDTPIFEDVTSRGARGTNLFWGAMKLEDGSWKGSNVLGKIWEEIRKEKLAFYTDRTKEDVYYKFGVGEDPYKALKEAHSAGEDIQLLNMETMRWVVIDSPTWDAPVNRYQIAVFA